VSATVGSGKVTLSGGATLKNFDRFYLFGPDSSFTCNGGVLQLHANRSLAVFNASAAVYVGNGGITFVTDNTGSAAATVIDIGAPLLAAPGATSGGFVKKGPGVLRLAKGNTYLAGPVDIQEGKVIALAANALPYTTLTLAEGAELELGGGWSPTQIDAIKALATVKGTVTHTLAVDEDVTISESLTAADVAAGRIANPKTGSGVLTLTGSNDFGGEFRVDEGTLAANWGQGLAWSDHLTLGTNSAFNSYNPALFAPLNGQVTNAVGSAGGEISFGSNTEAGFAAVVPTTVSLFNDARMLTANETLPRKLVFNTATLTNDICFLNPINLHGNSANLDLTVESGHAYVAAIDSYLDGAKSTEANSGSLAKKGAGTLHMPSASTIYYLYSQGGHLDYPAGGTYSFGFLQGNNADSLTTFGVGAKVTTRALTSSTWSKMVFNEGCEVTISKGATFEKGGTTIFSNATVTGGDLVTKKSDSSSGGTMLVKGGTFKNTGSGWMQAQDGGGFIFDGCTATISPSFIAGRTSSTAHPTSTSIIRGGAQMTFNNLYIMHGNLEIHDDGTLVKVNTAFAHGDADTASSASGPGYFLMTGGRIEVTGDITVGRRSGSVGLFRIEGGTMWLSSAKSIAVGNAGDGTLEVAGGVVDASVANGVALWPRWQGVETDYKKSERGMLRLLGGELKAAQIYGRSGADTTVEFDGGKLTLVNGSAATMFNNVANLRMGENGGEIDTGVNDFTVFKQFVALTNQTPKAVSGAAYNTAKAFVKSGSGKLTLKGANTYSCGCEVKAGTLALANGASLPSNQFVRLTGGTLDLGGSATQQATALLGTGGTLKNGTLTLTDGIYPGGYGTVGTMTIALDNAKLAGTVKVDFDETAKTCDKLVLSDAADISGLTIDLANLPARLPTGVARVDVLTGTNLVGMPTIVNKPSRLSVDISPSGVKVTKSGFYLVFR